MCSIWPCGVEQRPPPPRWHQSRVPLWRCRWKRRAAVANLCWQHISQSNAQRGRTPPSCAGPSADCKLGPVTCLSSVNFAEDSLLSFHCFLTVKGKSMVEVEFYFSLKGGHSNSFSESEHLYLRSLRISVSVTVLPFNKLNSQTSKRLSLAFPQ